MAENDLELVGIIRNEAMTTSLKVAKYFGKPHADVLKSIDRIIEDCAEMASEQEKEKYPSLKMFKKSTYEVEGQLRKYPFYFMNRDGFTLLAMGFTGKKALKFKLMYIAEFNKMEKIIQQWKNAEWLEIRNSVKKDFRKLTDAIRDYIIPLARKLGSTTPDNRFYVSWAKMLCKIGCYKPGTRNRLSLTQLFVLDQMQDIAVAAIKKLAPEGLPYKEIFQLAKLRLDDYARIAMVADRFTSLAVVD